MAKKRIGKFNNHYTTVDGITFHSKKESDRYIILKMLNKHGKIQNLELQKPFVLSIGKIKICSYVADFVYIENGKTIIEDVKGFRTDIYRLKKKLMKVILGLDIKET
jgi:protein associated with RNAse G/E